MTNPKWEKNNHACILPPPRLDKIAENTGWHVRSRGRVESCGITSFRRDMYITILSQSSFGNLHETFRRPGILICLNKSG